MAEKTLEEIQAEFLAECRMIAGTATPDSSSALISQLLFLDNGNRKGPGIYGFTPECFDALRPLVVTPYADSSLRPRIIKFIAHMAEEARIPVPPDYSQEIAGAVNAPADPAPGG